MLCPNGNLSNAPWSNGFVIFAVNVVGTSRLSSLTNFIASPTPST